MKFETQFNYGDSVRNLRGDGFIPWKVFGYIFDEGLVEPAVRVTHNAQTFMAPESTFELFMLKERQKERKNRGDYRK
tara:strand:- start:636 stop:866 length:231 start_codon:yes stop_codon:yes gene_type:complete